MCLKCIIIVVDKPINGVYPHQSKQSKDNEGNGVNKGATNDDVDGVENSPSAVTVNTDSDPSDEGNSPSAV